MRPAARLAVILVAASMAVATSGCTMSAWLAAQFGPKKNVPAKYDPPSGKTILVFVDDSEHPVDYQPIKMDLTEMLNQQLIAHEIAAKTIPYARLSEFISSTPNFNTLRISEIGARLGADMVLYVNIDDFGLRDPQASQELWKGRLTTTVRLVDVTKLRLWPKDKPDGYPVKTARTPTVSDTSPDRAEQISKELAADTADTIAKYFYDHNEPYEGAYGSKPEHIGD